MVEASGLACDHVHRYPEDIALLADAGLECYRFSVEWSRVEPEEGRFSERWLDHYRSMAACCASHGMLAVVTLHHFTNPRWIVRAGAWEEPHTARRFARYCAMVAEALGDLAALIITVNEPNIVALLGYENGVFPPGRRDRGARMSVTDTFIDAHRRAVEAIRAVRPQLPVGLALAMADWQALPGGELELEQTRRLREDVFLEAAKGDDFVGVNTYTRHRLGASGWAGNEPGEELTAAGYEFWPQVLESGSPACAGPTWRRDGRCSLRCRCWPDASRSTCGSCTSRATPFPARCRTWPTTRSRAARAMTPTRGGRRSARPIRGSPGALRNVVGAAIAHGAAGGGHMPSVSWIAGITTPTRPLILAACWSMGRRSGRRPSSGTACHGSTWPRSKRATRARPMRGLIASGATGSRAGAESWGAHVAHPPSCRRRVWIRRDVWPGTHIRAAWRAEG